MKYCILLQIFSVAFLQDLGCILNARFQFPRLLSKLERPYPAYRFSILSLPSLPPLNISQNQLGRNLGVSPRRINEIVHCKRSITTDTALRLAACFGNSPSFWLGEITQKRKVCFEREVRLLQCSFCQVLSGKYLTKHRIFHMLPTKCEIQ
ncbi:MAG: HigA family addiction module antidote protein [Deltaproteobacteria bacterium]|nr:HigA family addiction module antidote protein [Deltaproteobacteria bacterium]MBW1833359.1 HigA family addiction module antidote protein [Deltaproteobacteria bacterium]MBW2165375.1 HigA family addiction module antidote protein [Deltaproteobacteria bacterium]